MDDKGMVINRSRGRQRSRFGGWMLTQFQVALALVGVALSLLLFGGLGFLFGVWYQANENVRPNDDAIALAEEQLQREAVPQPAAQELTFYSTLGKSGRDVGPEPAQPVAAPASAPVLPVAAADTVSERSPSPDPVVSSLTAKARAQAATEGLPETPDRQAVDQVQMGPERPVAETTVSKDGPTVPPAAVIASPSEAVFFTVQVGSFRRAADADRLQQMLTQKGYVVRMLNVAVPGKGIWHRVRVGKFTSPSDANEMAQRLRAKEQMSVLVTRETR